ncbi:MULTISPECIES: hypothetical protein [unclassified Serratia (in: enterobacteria)]|uniref:hypothetical protein n=1 Tax=unclassified Serratia (in: enterobacteria) TaxID=2647522 RepID=UPI003076138E
MLKRILLIFLVVVIVKSYFIDEGKSIVSSNGNSVDDNIESSVLFNESVPDGFLPFNPQALCKVFYGSGFLSNSRGWNNNSGGGYSCATPYHDFPLSNSDSDYQLNDNIAFYVMADSDDDGHYARYTTIMLNVNKKANEKIRREDFIRAVSFFYKGVFETELDSKTNSLLSTFKSGFTRDISVNNKKLKVIFKREPFSTGKGVEFTMRVYPSGVSIPDSHRVN